MVNDLVQVLGQTRHRFGIVLTLFDAVLPEPRFRRDLNAEIEKEIEQRRRGGRTTTGNAANTTTTTTATRAVGDELVSNVVVVDRPQWTEYVVVIGCGDLRRVQPHQLQQQEKKFTMNLQRDGSR